MFIFRSLRPSIAVPLVQNKTRSSDDLEAQRWYVYIMVFISTKLFHVIAELSEMINRRCSCVIYIASHPNVEHVGIDRSSPTNRRISIKISFLDIQNIYVVIS